MTEYLADHQITAHQELTPLSERMALLLRHSRKLKRDVAAECGVAPPTLSQWLGSTVCGTAHLARFVHAVVLDSADRSTELFHLLLLQQKQQLLAEADLLTEPSSHVSEALEVLDRRIGCLRVRRFDDGPRPTLRDFPSAFTPLIVVVGDKREWTGTDLSAADFMAYGGSPTQLRWLEWLGLGDVEIHGDKAFVLKSLGELREQFGKTNILCIGGPVTNHLSRRCFMAEPHLVSGWQSATPVFRFSVESQHLLGIERTLGELRGLSPERMHAEISEPSRQIEQKERLQHLFEGCIIDPRYEESWISYSSPGDRNRALVTMARNPLARAQDPYVCILAAGFNRIGTAHAIRMLANPANFSRFPLGGILQVRVDPNLVGPDRFDHSKSGWFESESRQAAVGYVVEDLCRGFETMLDRAQGNMDRRNVDPVAGERIIPPIMSEKEVRNSLKFVRSFETQREDVATSTA